MKMNFKSIISKKLSSNDVNNICRIKNTHWKFGIQNQRNWFNKNVNKDDIHNLLYKNKEIVGYNFLRKRTYKVGKRQIKKKYLYFDTLIIKKKYRNLGLGKKLMDLNSSVIKRNSTVSFLICKRNLYEFYKKNGWKFLNSNDSKIIDHNTKKKIMYLNSKKKLKNVKIYLNK